MTIGNCKVIAIEGAHCTGKSTLIQALTAYYKSHHIHAANFIETARKSPFIEQALVYQKGEIDIFAELHLFSSHIRQELASARNHELLICDRTVASILGYANILLTANPNTFEEDILKAIKCLATAYSPIYDAVFYLSDMYMIQRTNDPFRGSIMQSPGIQTKTDTAIKKSCNAIGIKRIEVPKGMELADKVSWVAKKANQILKFDLS